MAISGSCIPVLVSALPVRFQASARPSKTSHNVTLTFQPHVNTDLQSQSQVLTFLVAGCYLDGVDLIGEPAFYASLRKCHIASQPQEGNNASSSEKKAPVPSNCLKPLPTSGSHGLSLRRGPCVAPWRKLAQELSGNGIWGRLGEEPSEAGDCQLGLLPQPQRRANLLSSCSLVWHPLSADGTQDGLSADQQLPCLQCLAFLKPQGSLPANTSTLNNLHSS